MDGLIMSGISSGMEGQDDKLRDWRQEATGPSRNRIRRDSSTDCGLRSWP